VSIKVREWIFSAVALLDLMFEAQPPSRNRTAACLSIAWYALERVPTFKVVRPSAQRAIQLAHDRSSATAQTDRPYAGSYRTDLIDPRFQFLNRIAFAVVIARVFAIIATKQRLADLVREFKIARPVLGPMPQRV